MKERLVIDTSIFVSALMGQTGPSRELIRRCLQGSDHPLMGNALFLEYESVIAREEIKANCPLSESEIQELLEAFLSVCQWVNIYYLWRPNLRDEADNHLIELAVAGKASVIVTNNVKDFQKAELLFPSLSILKPEDMIRR